MTTNIEENVAVPVIHHIEGHVVFHTRQPYTSCEKAYDILELYLLRELKGKTLKTGQILTFERSWPFSFSITIKLFEQVHSGRGEIFLSQEIDEGIVPMRTSGFRDLTFENHDERITPEEEMYQDKSFINWLLEKAFEHQTIREVYELYEKQ